MEELKAGSQKPYIIHMNWNSNSQEKKDMMVKHGFWFVKDECLSSDTTTTSSSSPILWNNECCIE